jgi:2,3-bisphosphoglycerate-dependent phosphoglycerate mutase
MQLYFIRHGQSENNALWDRSGSGAGRSHDPALTETGCQQAQWLTKFLAEHGPGFAPDGEDLQNAAGFGLTHLYTSLMVRAVQTGTIVAQTLDIPLVAWVDVHEGGGIYLNDEDTGEPVGLPGNPRSYFEQNFPGLVLPDWLDESGWWKNRPFESRLERRARAQRFVKELIHRHGNSNDRVAVISHGGFFNQVMAALLNPLEADRPPSQLAVETLIGDNVIITDDREVWFSMNNCAITRIDFLAEEIKLVYLNRLDFLPDELVT